MGREWPDCIVVYVDLIGVKDVSRTEGSALMRKLQGLALEEVPKLEHVKHAYVWNDSVLLLAFVSKPSFYVRAMKDADSFKRRIDQQLRKSYAVAVKGQTFPVEARNASDGRVTVLQTSSWAMANCLKIEAKLKSHRAAWYVDGRIAKELEGAACPSSTCRLKLFPEKRERNVHLYKGYLWPEPRAVPRHHAPMNSGARSRRRRAAS